MQGNRQRSDSAEYLTRAQLYQRVEQIREQLGLYRPPFSFGMLRKRVAGEIEVIEHYFDSRVMQGALIRASKGRRSVVLINLRRNEVSRKFVLCHELIHYYLHLQGARFLCNLLESDQLVEWQANEGAAQLLVPYQIFLQSCLRHRFLILSDSARAIPLLAEEFGVSQQTILYRLQTLAGELAQVFEGVAPDQVEVLTSRERARRIAGLPGEEGWPAHRARSSIDIYCED